MTFADVFCSPSSATNGITYDEIRRRIGRYLAMDYAPADWSSSEIRAVDDAIRRGVRSFYYPSSEQPHYWSFMRKSLTISLTDTNTWYDLPADFIAMESVVSMGGGSVALDQVDAMHLRLKVANEAGTGSPLQYAVRQKSGETIYQAGFYPTPNASISVECWYVYDPGDVTVTKTIPAGAADHAETIAVSCLAAAEMELKPESIGESGGIYQAQFQQLLATSIIRDQRLARGVGA